MDMAALQNFNFINIDFRNWFSKFQINISKIDYFTDKAMKYKTDCKMRTRSCDVTKIGE